MLTLAHSYVGRSSSCECRATPLDIAKLIVSSSYHVLATIFFDFTALYILGQLATAPRSGESARAWWVALGVYALCTAIWLVGVVGWHECWRGLVRTSRMDERKLQLRDVYLSAVYVLSVFPSPCTRLTRPCSRFNGACMRSYGFFCCLCVLQHDEHDAR